MTKLNVACLLSLVLGACHAEPSTFGQSFDECMLKHGVSDATKDICARHFSRAASDAEKAKIQTASVVDLAVTPMPFGGGGIDNITARIFNDDDDLVIRRVNVVATFCSDSACRKALPGMPLKWDLPVDSSDQSIGWFADGKAPSRYYRAFVVPSSVYSHTAH